MSYLPSMMESPIAWLCDIVLEHYPNLYQTIVIDHPELSAREWLALRLQWGVENQFTFFYGDARGVYGALLMRPADDELLSKMALNYWGTIWDYAPRGDICVVDFAYGQGLYPDFIATCRRSKRPRIAWRHNERIHLVDMSRMPARDVLATVH